MRHPHDSPPEDQSRPVDAQPGADNCDVSRKQLLDLIRQGDCAMSSAACASASTARNSNGTGDLKKNRRRIKSALPLSVR